MKQKSQALILLVVLCFFSAPNNASTLPEDTWFTADENHQGVVHFYFFWSKYCPHCLDTLPIIDELEQNLPWLAVQRFELVDNIDYRYRYQHMAKAFGQPSNAVPAMFYCNQMQVGAGEQLKDYLQAALIKCRQQYLSKRDGPLITPDTVVQSSGPDVEAWYRSGLSLPVITIAIAALDAFNPCAFFVMLFLLSLLVHAGSRKRMVIIGGVFVLFSGLIYFLFMAAWLNVFLIAGPIQIVTVIAGAVAVIFASLNIRDYFRTDQVATLAIPEKAKPGLFKRMRHLLNAENMPTMLVGTVTLAIIANSYELLCTSGFPMVFTRILTLEQMSSGSYYAYLALYNLVYIIPLAIIVTLFTYTLGSRKLQQQEGKLLKLMSGMMMLGLGTVLLVSPELLTNLWTAVSLLIVAVGLTILAYWMKRKAEHNK